MDNRVKNELRSELFMNLEGIPMVAVLAVLSNAGVLDYIKEIGQISFDDLCNQFPCNKGYMGVSLRLLNTQGYVISKSDQNSLNPKYEITEKGRATFALGQTFNKIYDHYPLFRKVSMVYEAPLDRTLLDELRQVKGELKNNWGVASIESNPHLFANINGPLKGALLVSLGMSLDIKKIVSSGKIEIEDNESLRTRLECMELFSWGRIEGSTFVCNEMGIFFLKRCAAYGVTVSYLQTFVWLEELLFGKGDKLWDKPINTTEIHVDRTMNVWGSGGAHSAYFDKIDEVIVEIFNRPLDKQPKGIADMGCGNGAFLIHLNEVVKNKTLRGKHLKEYPLLLIGSDFNAAAIESTRKNFEEEGVVGHFLHGDIGDPEDLANKLESEFGVKLNEVLNVRSFLDHNRIFENVKGDYTARQPIGSGAYSFRGRWVNNKEIEENLKEHFIKWKPFVKDFGLLVIELHTIRPEVASKHIGKTAIAAYDATHGFTDQYIVEHEVFLNIAKEAGLQAVSKYQSTFPNEEMTTVSINLLRE